ncbi:MAG: DUF6504 family protein [Anaerolineae bacterium]|jgi:hypothetical protein|nr:DUF6504 family protein [Anaerolineae bacterium]
MRLHNPGIPIRVQADPQGRPEAFTLRGRLHRVASLEEHREPRLDWWSPLGEAHRCYWLVATERDLICELCQDQADGSWRLVRELD